MCLVSRRQRTRMKNDVWFLLAASISLLAISPSFAETRRPCATDGCVHGNGLLKCQSCEVGCWGHNCSSPCWDNCHKDGCDRNTGQCFLCKPGFHGPRCDTPCPQSCAGNHLDGSSYCEQDTGECYQTCQRDSTDTNCDGRCPPNCKDKICDKVTAKCLVGCLPGLRGDFCNISCSNCLRGRCSSNGYCLEGCSAGFYGQMCERTCPRCWTSGCDRQSGICEQCQPGYHGRHCNKRCPNKCHADWNDDRNCDRESGRCSQGCEAGWHGSHCQTKCSPHCRSLCLSVDGSCVGGCVKGHYGKHCHSTCSTCKDNDCDLHGRCRQCKDGFYGDSCDQPCPKGCDTCDQEGDCVPAVDGKPSSSAAFMYSNTLVTLAGVVYMILCTDMMRR